MPPTTTTTTMSCEERLQKGPQVVQLANGCLKGLFPGTLDTAESQICQMGLDFNELASDLWPDVVSFLLAVKGNGKGAVGAAGKVLSHVKPIGEAGEGGVDQVKSYQKAMEDTTDDDVKENAKKSKSKISKHLGDGISAQKTGGAGFLALKDCMGDGCGGRDWAATGEDICSIIPLLVNPDLPRPCPDPAPAPPPAQASTVAEVSLILEGMGFETAKVNPWCVADAVAFTTFCASLAFDLDPAPNATNPAPNATDWTHLNVGLNVAADVSALLLSYQQLKDNNCLPKNAPGQLDALESASPTSLALNAMSHQSEILEAANAGVDAQRIGDNFGVGRYIGVILGKLSSGETVV